MTVSYSITVALKFKRTCKSLRYIKRIAISFLRFALFCENEYRNELSNVHYALGHLLTKNLLQEENVILGLLVNGRALARNIQHFINLFRALLVGFTRRPRLVVIERFPLQQQEDTTQPCNEYLQTRYCIALQGTAHLRQHHVFVVVIHVAQ